MANRNKLLDRFYLIIDNTDNLEPFLQTGVRCIQLRIKDKSVDECRAQIRVAKKLCGQFDCQLIINDYWQLALEEECDCIHLGQEDLSGADMASLKKAQIKIGISTHDKAELAIALSHEPDYIALGPIYATLLKKCPGVHRGWRNYSAGKMPLVIFPW